MEFKNVVKIKMLEKEIDNLGELSRLTGMGYQTMRMKLKHPEQLRVYEIQALDEVLSFDDAELIRAIRG